jgi:ABC-2 type transport system ATP-binding protein
MTLIEPTLLTAPAVATTGLTKRFGRTLAVDHLDIALSGGVIGVLGPNGAGKSTLLRMLATVLAPDEGGLRLLGHDPASPAGRVAIRRRLGFLPQSPRLYPAFTPRELVDYVAVLKEHTDRRVRRPEVTRVLEAVGLTTVMHRKIRTLSGGMHQRVALAAALLGDPCLLVLDEPATGLDPEQRLELRSLLARSAQRGGVVLSTHNTGEVTALCQQVLVMRAGGIRFHGTPAELVEAARGRVWESEQPDASATLSWMTASGDHRHIGDPPAGATPAEPTIEDGYLLVSREGR